MTTPEPPANPPDPESLPPESAPETEPPPDPPVPAESAPTVAPAPVPESAPVPVPSQALPTRTGDQQMWQVLSHASAFIQVIGIPSLVGPLIVWLMKRDDPAVEPHARAALNFQLSLLIYFIAGSILAFLFAVTVVGLVVTIPLVIALIVLFILELVFALLASLAASRGEMYAYPLSIELIKR
jgi:uncharacterized Tic20 family protein